MSYITDIQDYINLFGSERVDEEAETRKAYQEFVVKYPGAKDMSCAMVKSTIDALQFDIDSITQARAMGTTDRVGARYIAAATQRKGDFEKLFSQMNCVAMIEANERQGFLDDQYNQLQRVQGLTQEAGKTTTWIIWGMLGLIVITAGIIVIKRLNK